MSMFRKKTKVVATLGPATHRREVIAEMISLGVNAFRINFSHADYETVEEAVKMVHEINEEKGYNVAVLADLQGPKLRLGEVKDGVFVKVGDPVSFTNQQRLGTRRQVYMTYARFPLDVNPGETVLLDDGKLIMEVVDTNRRDLVRARVVQGGSMRSRKGVNLPQTKISLPALTEKDRRDAIFAVGLGVDWVALSFVRTPADLMALRALLNEHADHRIPIIAKIEKPEAVKNIDGILLHADGLMVARGDLGVEMPAEEVPLIQKMLVRKAKVARKPVIIATQMMESMTDSLTPTRAEVNDVANSVMDGTDAVMLSGETAVGKYPVAVIKSMVEIIKRVEDSRLISRPDHNPDPAEKKRYLTNVICYDAAQMAVQIDAQAIVTLTHSGYTAFQLSSHRPFCHTLAFTDNRNILRMLNLLWGVYAFYYDKWHTTDKTIREVNQIAVKKGIVQKGDYILNLSAMPVREKGMVNTIRITEIG